MNWFEVRPIDYSIYIGIYIYYKVGFALRIINDPSVYGVVPLVVCIPQVEKRGIIRLYYYV